MLLHSCLRLNLNRLSEKYLFCWCSKLEREIMHSCRGSCMFARGERKQQIRERERERDEVNKEINKVSSEIELALAIV